MVEPTPLHRYPLHALQSGGGGGTFDGDMEARLKALETRSEKLDARLDTLIRDVAEIKGKLSNMPSTWQMIGLMVTLLGLAFVILKFSVPGSP